MIGLLVLGVGAVWLVFAFAVARLVALKLPAGRWRLPIAAVLFVVLVPLPIADEIFAKREFEELCRSKAVIQVDREKAAGKTVYLADLPTIEIQGTWLRAFLQPWRYEDAKTGEIVLEYSTLQADRGLLFRGIALSGGPLTFDGYCAPGGSRSTVTPVFKELGITRINRSEKP